MAYSQQSSHTGSTDGPLISQEIDFSKITYSELTAGKASSSFKSAYINYNGSNMMVQTPWLNTWDGICQPAEEYRQPGAPPKYQLSLSLKGNNAAEVGAFQKFLSDFDDKILTDASGPLCSQWFKGKKEGSMTKEVCEALFNKQLKLAKDKETGELTDKYPANFKTKVPYYDGTWKCELYNAKHEELTGDLSTHLTGKCEVRAILRCSAVWFAGGKFGVSWQAHQLEYKPADAIPKHTYQFRGTAEDNHVGETTIAPSAHREIVDNNDAEGGEEDEEEVPDSDMD